MSGILFDELIFGPVHSRRLGISLGINLLPTNNKFCNFNCIYCECGWTNNKATKLVLPKRTDFKRLLSEKLQALQHTPNEPDAITFAGNGEPTTHPEFAGIIDDTLEARDLYAPKAAVTVLSNASMLHKKKIRDALVKVDKNIQKLDAGTQLTFERLNQPLGSLTLEKIINNLLLIKDNLIIQTLFVRGKYNGYFIDNTTPEEISAWLELIKKIQPAAVMLYSIDRETPVKSLEKISGQELENIAKMVEELGIHTEVFG
ncbi:MAG: radical SAM protein [Bacteroidetes bacterium HGW-Bacteroidetes-16]|nr:MAG: radical SAM protein [Bacteroidetes bacterium HGW-Bacteroidetes-16]